jgi:hypothetical protein
MTEQYDMDKVHEHYVETPNGEPITGLVEMKGKCYVFTASETFVLVPRKEPWYRRLWRWLVRLKI